MSGNKGLVEQVRERVDADAQLAVETGLLVLAALEGEEALRRARAETEEVAAQATTTARGTQPELPNGPPASAYLQSISVQGFRGIGARTTLHIPPGPGLTVVTGRNGSGKSSLSEALELLLTGENRRWTNKAAVWKQGWRNLHWNGPVEIEAALSVEGKSDALLVRREWPVGVDTPDRIPPTLRGAYSSNSFATIGWETALSTYRPFLPYNELGSIPEYKPSELYDMMSAALGLDALIQARKRLRDLRRERENLFQDAENDRTPLLASIDNLDDERARECAQAIKSPRADDWDLDRVELVLAGALAPSGDGDISTLRELATLRVPNAAEVKRAATCLRTAITTTQVVAKTDSGRARQHADLLERSLELHTAHGDQPCPVCGAGRLNNDWKAETKAAVARLRKEAADATQAHLELATARDAGRELLAAPPAVLRLVDVQEVDPAPLLAAWACWHDFPADAQDADLAKHLEQAHGDVVAEADTLRVAAATELERREDVWRPVEHELRQWLSKAKPAALARKYFLMVRNAETWLDAETDKIRAERFRPIADQAAAIWDLLRQNSAVELAGLELAGSATRRHLALDVSVDGADGKALGVMSQGEIHALALSLFLPRVLLPDSPFGFVIIDDPVQAMDPGKVDGLARVLEETARTRQVVVFTHDERLPESVRRLQIPAAVIEVSRRPGSLVECRPTRDPLTQYLEDARALSLTDDIPEPAAARTVPLFCRLAVEAACTEAIRRRRIGRGESHSSVEETLVGARTLLQKLALALFDDRDRAGEVIRSVNGRWGLNAGGAIRTVNRGTHEGITTSQLAGLIDEASRVADSVRHLS